MGTMLPTHIFDRTISPCIFIGVVGINITINAIKQLEDTCTDEVLSGVVTVSAVRYSLFETDLAVLIHLKVRDQQEMRLYALLKIAQIKLSKQNLFVQCERIHI